MSTRIKNIIKLHGLSKHPLYLVWQGIKNRCYNNKFQQYRDYGDKGVVMCQEWKNDFKSFYDWCINNGWQKGLQINKDINGDGLLYSPNNCLIVTAKENSSNRRSNVIVNYEGKSFTLKQFATIYKFNYKLLSERMKKGWSFEKSITTPLMKNQYSLTA